MKRMIKRFVAGAIMVTMLTTPVFAKEGDSFFNEELGVVFIEVHKDGVAYWKNQTTGELTKIETAKKGEEAGSRTIKAIVKNGVTMVSLVDLAKAMDVKLVDEDKKYQNTEWESYTLEAGTYEKGKGGTYLIIYKPKSRLAKKGFEYSCFVNIYHESGYKVNPSIDLKFAPKNAEIEMTWMQDKAVYPQFSYGEDYIPCTQFNISGKFSAGKAEYINNVLYVPAKDVINLINQEITEVKYNKANKTITFEKKNQYSHME